MAKPATISEAREWLEEDARIHDQWAEFLRANPKFPRRNVGGVRHHEKWARRYRRLLAMIERLDAKA